MIEGFSAKEALSHPSDGAFFDVSFFETISGV